MVALGAVVLWVVALASVALESGSSILFKSAFEFRNSPTFLVVESNFGWHTSGTIWNTYTRIIAVDFDGTWAAIETYIKHKVKASKLLCRSDTI